MKSLLFRGCVFLCLMAAGLGGALYVSAQTDDLARLSRLYQLPTASSPPNPEHLNRHPHPQAGADSSRSAETQSVPRRNFNPLRLGYRWVYGVYRHQISPQLGTQCPYAVTCSRFSLRAMARYGLIKGLALTTDRLTRCTGLAHRDEVYPETEAGLHDPVSHYSNRPPERK